MINKRGEICRKLSAMSLTVEQTTQTRFHLTGGALQWSSLCAIHEKKPFLSLSQEARDRIEQGHAFLMKKLREGQNPYYGINTGFGYLQNKRIPAEERKALQVNLLRSHASGTGASLAPELVRWMLLLKIQALSLGYSGISLKTVQRLVELYNEDILPDIPEQGSLGASGDLCPLSHLALPLIGEGWVWYRKKRQPAMKVLASLGWEPLQLDAKEGLALINGTQFMTALGIEALFRATHQWSWAQWIAALSTDVFGGSAQPFHPAIHRLRPHPGQIRSASEIHSLLALSPMQEMPRQEVQDPYSFRCIPQVHGAVWDIVERMRQVMVTEANSVTDNPILVPEQDLILSGGNFHGEPLAFALDHLSIAMAELGNISERRTYQLVSGQRGLPLFLTADPGLQSGWMIPQYTAASLVSENKQLATPASVDSIVSSNGQEDHVSMGANAARQCLRILDNTEKILAIEWLTALQAIEFRRPQKTFPFIEKLITAFREQVPYQPDDHILAQDIQGAIQFIQQTKIPDHDLH